VLLTLIKMCDVESIHVQVLDKTCIANYCIVSIPVEGMGVHYSLIM